VLRDANLVLSFLLELGALAALAYWGIRVGNTITAKVALGLGAPLGAAVLWALFAAPKATFPLPALAVLVKILVFGSAALGLWTTGHRQLALAFAALVVVNTIVASL
jgi:hypothetical protein